MADAKSMKSYASSYADSLSYSGMSKSSRNEARRARHAAKLKRREENKTQTKLLFRPRVYDFWREGDLDFDAAERERLLKDIALKEKRLRERRRLRMEEGDGMSDTDSEDDQVMKELEKLKTRKQRQDEYKQKLEDDKKRQEEDERLEMEEKLASELQNPSVYGWYYTDGYYDNAPYFGVREDLVEKLAGEQEAFREKWAQKYPETFTDMFKRYFWPPKYLCKGSTFRTRGSYLDFPEVIADWPKGVEVNFERDAREYITNRHELFGLDQEQMEQDEADLEAAIVEEEMNREEEIDAETAAAVALKDRLLKINRNLVVDWSIDTARMDAYSWYYDDEEGQFYPKRLGFEIEYYYDDVNNCWRHKKKRGRYVSENQQTPYDYYFDDSTSEFVPREHYQGLDEIVYDHKSGVFRIHLINKSVRRTKSGKIIIEFPEFKPTEFEYGEDGEIIGVAEGSTKKKHSPKGYYFDEEFGKWVLRTEMPEGVTSADITWDENGKRYARKFEGVWRGLTGMSPDDNYWSDRARKFYPKPPRQADNFKYFPQHGVWRRLDEVNTMTALHPDDIERWYFDDFEGQFKPKDMAQGSHNRYIQGIYSKIWRRVAKPKSNMYPDEFYYDTYKKRWLPRAIRMEMLKNAEIARQRNIMEAQRGGGGADNMWDMKQNDINTKQTDFYFDVEEGMFLKKKPKVEYFFDEVDWCYKLPAAKEKPRQTRFLHEYYFDGDGQFYLKEPGGDYTYDKKFHVWKKAGLTVDLSTVDPPPSKYFYDIPTAMFKQKGSESLRFDHNLKWEVNPSPDPNYRCPDDYYFDESEGRFYLKDADYAKVGRYVYDQTLGAWLHSDLRGLPTPNDLTPRSFYWDDSSRSFKLKVKSKEKVDYTWDPNNKIFRHVLSSGKTKSGLRPADFMWNSEFRAYIPRSFLRKGRGANINELPKWDPMRLYDKPWQVDEALSYHSSPVTSSVLKNGKDVGTITDKKPEGKGNKVAPAPSPAKGPAPSQAKGPAPSPAKGSAPSQVKGPAPSQAKGPAPSQAKGPAPSPAAAPSPASAPSPAAAPSPATAPSPASAPASAPALAPASMYSSNENMQKKTTEKKK